jgi:hypothetical protein
MRGWCEAGPMGRQDFIRQEVFAADAFHAQTRNVL